MPSLIVSSGYSTDSKLLRQAAQARSWETLRLDGRKVPDWFEPPDEQVAVFCTAPSIFDIADQFSRKMLGCNPSWTLELPGEFLLRELRQTLLEEALQLPGESFVKHANSKAFPAGLYDADRLAEATSKIPASALVHVGEPVHWLVEYRCFVAERQVATISPYRRHGEVIQNHADLLGAPPTEIEQARQFADVVLSSPAVASPAAFVLDVGIIEGRGWAVVECNQCWAAGIYACDPARVLDVLLRACVPADEVNDDYLWDFKQHYFAARG